MVRSLIVMAMFAASLADAAWNNYQEQRDLDLDATGIDTVDVEAGAGSLDISGVPGSGVIEVQATIEVPDRDDDKARKIIESRLELSLDRQGDKAVLKAYFNRNFLGMDDEPRVHLVVRVPRDVNLVIDDGSGSMSVSDVSGSVNIDDGSGSITLANIGGALSINDGSGSITARKLGGDVSIEDGSGSIDVEGVAGSVIIDDGSGSIGVRDVLQDLTIIDAGSGGVRIKDVQGNVKTDT